MNGLCVLVIHLIEPIHYCALLKFSFDLCFVLSICLFVCFVCLCPMIDKLRVNVVREVWKSLKLKILSNYSLVKGKCVLDLLS
jgi:hypothetical protein